MKKRWKIFWIVCGVMFGAGILFYGAGRLMGADLQTTAAAVSDRFGGGLLKRALDQNGKRIAKKVSDGMTYDYGERAEDPDTREAYQGIRNLKLDVAGVAVQILPSEDADVHVETEGLSAKRKYSCTQDGENLEISTELSLRAAGRLKDHGTIWIYLPETQLDTIDLCNDAGVVYVQRLSADTFSLDVGAGTAQLDDFTVRHGEIDCGVGTVTGKGTAAEKLAVDCGVGEVTLTLCGKAADYSRDVTCGVGDVTIAGTSCGGSETDGETDHEESDSHGSGKDEQEHSEQEHSETDEDDHAQTETAGKESRVLSVDCGIGSVEIGFTEE